VQSAKDSFYEMLRERIAGLNPDRTIVVRGVVRPAVLVVENELVVGAVLPDCFRLNWGEVKVDESGCLPMVAMTCSIEYETAGTAMNAGMDRGRVLAAMDGELMAALRECPQSVLKTNYAGLAFGQSAVAMKTNVWWGDVSLGALTVEGERVRREAVVMVMNYQEAGEL
jgi:hypothetical protein